MRQIVLVAHNLRSCHNVGSLIRTAEGLGVERVYLTGYTPYPKMKNDARLPHLADKIDRQISKTALGAEKMVKWEQRTDVIEIIHELSDEGYEVCALEQEEGSTSLPDFRPSGKVALLVGNEVEGLSSELMAQCSKLLEIPMAGKKESFNVVQAAAMALFHIVVK